jgi:YVTN family beta-propeller protein
MVTAICLNPQNDKVYSTSSKWNGAWDERVTVIDAATDSTLTSIAVGDVPRALCYNPQDNKVYCANSVSNNVTVIDGVTDSVLATVPTGLCPISLCYNSQNNKVYTADSVGHTVTVIDGATDSVLATVTPVSGAYPGFLCYNPQDNKVCCVTAYSGGWPPGLTTIDGASDSVINTRAAFYISGLGYDSLYDKVYYAEEGSDTVVILDGSSNFRDTAVAVGDGPGTLLCGLPQGRAYVANRGSSNMSVVRDTTPSGVEARNIDVRRLGAASVVRGVLFLPGASSHKPQAASLLDISGRKVMDLQSGANDVRALAPGVYFVRERSGARGQGSGRMRKVVITQ